MSKAEPETPYVIDDAELNCEPYDEEEHCFYINKSWFSKKNFPVYTKSYKPAFLEELDEGIWTEFNRDVAHYQSYCSRISWYYKIWTIAPVCWFLIMVLPDLLWYYDIVFNGVGIICGLVLGLAFSFDTCLQRRFLSMKVRPMYELLIDTYKPRFLMCGYLIDFRLEPTYLDGMNSYIQFRRAPAGHHEKPSESLHGGFYIDEDFLGCKPYVLQMTSTIIPPRFLRGIDTDTWTAFSHDVKQRSKTPKTYLLGWTIAMGLTLFSFCGGLVFFVVHLAALRHWLLILLFPLYALANMMRSFRRRHYVENVMEGQMSKLMYEYQGRFAAAGFRGSFELEYIMGYLALNTYFTFQNNNSGDYECEMDPLGDSTTTV